MFCSNGFCHVSVFSVTSYLVSLFVVIDWLTLIAQRSHKGEYKDVKNSHIRKYKGVRRTFDQIK